MKQSEIASLVTVAAVSVIIAYFVANALLGAPSGDSVKVKTTAEFSTEIVEPDSTIFNADAINPTVEVVIGENATP